MEKFDNVFSSHPSFAQVTAVVSFMQKHADLARAKLRNGRNNHRAKKLWTQMSNIANSIPGTTKSTQGWMKFWMHKKCLVKAKKKLLDDGKISRIMTPIEERIWELCFHNGNRITVKKGGAIKEEQEEERLSDEEDSSDNIPLKIKNLTETLKFNDQSVTDVEVRQIVVMEKLVQVMDKQTAALSQMARSSFSNAQALDRFAEASQMQGRAVEQIASTFEDISAAFHDVCNAIINIDYTMKRCYTTDQT